jgi:hypothetical protein
MTETPETPETPTPKVATLADEPLNIIREGADPLAGSDAPGDESVRAESSGDPDADPDAHIDAERDHLDWLENQLSATRAERLHRATFLLTIMASSLAVLLIAAVITWRLFH